VGIRKVGGPQNKTRFQSGEYREPKLRARGGSRATSGPIQATHGGIQPGWPSRADLRKAKGRKKRIRPIDRCEQRGGGGGGDRVETTSNTPGSQRTGTTQGEKEADPYVLRVGQWGRLTSGGGGWKRWRGRNGEVAASVAVGGLKINLGKECTGTDKLSLG